MAINGSVSQTLNLIGLYGKSYSVTFTLHWLKISHSVENNSSTIQWWVDAIYHNGYKTGSDPNDTAYYKVVIDGTPYSGNYPFNNASEGELRELVSGTAVIPHNADGTKTFSYSHKHSAYAAASSTGTLDTIPRPASIVSAVDFNDEENPTITYSNPSGELVSNLEACISFDGSADNVPYRAISKTDGTYTFNLTSAERKTLRQYITSGNSATVRFYVRTTIDGETYHSYITKTLTLANYTPTLSEVITDTNSRTVALTGNSNKLIRYFSNARVVFNAQARKEATIESKRVINGSHTIDVEDREQNFVDISGVDSNTFYLSATDSRGFTVQKASVKAFVEYVKLTSSLDTNLLTANGEITFTIKGKYFNGSFGAINNSLEVEYLILDESGDPVFNKDGSGWVRLGAVTPTIEGTDYTYTYTITGLDYQGTYELTVNAIDELTPVQSSTKVIAATPIFDWGKNDFKHHTNVYLDNNKTLRSYQNDGRDVQILGLNASNGTVLGWGGYDNSNGDTGVYGNNVRIHTKEKLFINGREYGANKVLWESTGWYMNATQTANLKEAISAQPNGIVLVFSLYRDGAAEDVSINSFFVSKKEVELLPGAPHTFFMMINSGFSVIGAKYLYIDDTSITGHATNNSAGSNNNLSYNNDNFVLRYVIGV